jgi:hypothetical protein
MRIRTRYRKALHAGMSIAAASAYANGPDSAGPSVAAGAQVELTDAPSAAEGSGAAQSKSGRGSEPVATATPLRPKPPFSASTDNPGHHEKRDADRLVHHPDHVVFQALLAQNLNAFSEFAFGVIRPGLLFKPNWHLEAVAEKLSQVASGKIRRLIMTLPPRNLKSLYASVALPAWFLGHNPSERVVVISYSDFLTRQHANDFRGLVNHPI